MDIAAWYRHFARVEAAGSSPSYERLAGAVAESPALLARLATLPPGKQQPNLLFASVSYLGGPLDDPAELVEWVLAAWDALADTMRSIDADQRGGADGCVLARDGEAALALCDPHGSWLAGP